MVVNYYSRYIEEEFLRSTDKFIASLRRMFLTHGLPVSITTDNGPQFIGQDNQSFVEEEYINHRTVTPLCHQENGEVERKISPCLRGSRLHKSRGKIGKRKLNSS